MAEDDPRVHKATEVHKRRASKKVRPDAGKRAAAAEASRSAEIPKAAETPKGAEAVAAPQPSAMVLARAVAERAVASESAAPQSAPSVETPVSAVGELRKRKAPGPATDGAEQRATSNPTDSEPEKRTVPKRKRWGLRIAIAVACLVVAGTLVFAGFAGGSRWLRYNDEHDIEGTWYIDGTDVPIAFADGKIVFDSDTAYAYTIDPQAKTISYSLGDLEGQGRYWFSQDRGTLIITDGSDFTMWSTLFDDLAYDISRFFGNEELPMSEGSIVLTHVITLNGGTEGAGSNEAVDDAVAPAGDGADGEPNGESSEGAAEGAGDNADNADDADNADKKPGKKNDFGDLAISDVLAEEEETEEHAE